MSSSADPSQNIVRILIADDRPVVREGLTAILELKKLNAIGRTEAIAIASWRGLVDID